MATYKLADSVPDAIRDELFSYSSFLQQLLYQRGIQTAQEAHAFLNPSYTEHLHDPFLLHDMEKAVGRILEAIKNKEEIAIYSDYDCDGIPGAVVLYDFFTAIGYTQFQNYIPHRHYEGFGFNADAVRKLAEQNVSLIITIDCGTTDSNAVAVAKALGIDVIITDHHEPKKGLPEAFAIVNPKVGDSYPFSGLCGSGVVYKLLLAVIQQGKKDSIFSLKEGGEKWWLDMVGLATIADMVPLVGENRALAHFGLQVLRKSRRLGLQQLLLAQKTDMRYLTEDDIGFTIGPRINAASRMDNPEDAFLMLTSSNVSDAGARVAHLEKLNNERKGIVASMTKEAHKHLNALESIPAVLVLGNPEWRPSLVGLVASKLAEEYNRPAFLWGRDGNGVLRGSCRSNGLISVVTVMNESPTVFLEYGGHHMSGGFSVREDAIHTFGECLNQAFEKIGDKATVASEIPVDLEITLDAVTHTFLKEQAQLAPFGMGNTKPLYLFRNVSPSAVTLFGKTKEHTKLTFDTKGVAQEAIAFFMLPESFTKQPKPEEPSNIYAHVEQSFFMGRLQTRLRIVDIV